jgi:hypothetical protein
MPHLVFTSACPRCKSERVQDGFSAGDLERLLAGGYPIEAYCADCDEFWAIGLQKRVELARWLLRPPSS